MKDSALFEALTLPNGAVLPNRLCKAAMEENLCDAGQIPGRRLYNLYQQWADGGAGLLLTGNVMISPDALTGPGGIVLQDEQNLSCFKQWSSIGRSSGAQFWMQINHPGRQLYAAMGEQALSASDIKVDLPGFDSLFAQPRAMSEVEIGEIIERFANTASLAEKAGFSGVQIHAAHGYLISQFLSPLTNRRSDHWGGSLPNRARILFEVVKAIRSRVSQKFCVSIKMNSADFQKGGFDQQDAKWVVQQLNALSLDLVELSGGSYESPAMQGGSDEPVDDASSTLKREAYFVDFARDIASVADMPIMVTGGIRKFEVAEQALEKDHAGFSVQVLGLARALAFQPDLPNQWKSGNAVAVRLPEISWKKKILAALAVMAVTKAQLNRMALGKPPKWGLNPAWALFMEQLKTKFRTRRYRKWRAAQSG